MQAKRIKLPVVITVSSLCLTCKDNNNFNKIILSWKKSQKTQNRYYFSDYCENGSIPFSHGTEGYILFRVDSGQPFNTIKYLIDDGTGSCVEYASVTFDE